MSESLQILPNVASTIALIVFLIGRFQVKKNIKLHIKLMSLAMLMDFILVFGLTIFRNALGTVAGGSISTLLALHVSLALTTILCYFIAIYLGFKLKKGDRSHLKSMRILDNVILPVRLLNSYTSWLLFIGI